MFYQNLRYNWNKIQLKQSPYWGNDWEPRDYDRGIILLPIKGLFQIFVTSRNYNIDSCDANSNCSWKQSATSFVLLRRLFLLGPGFLNFIPGFLRQICWVHRERKLNLQFSNFKLLLQSSIKQNSNPPHPAKIVTISWTWSVIRNQFISKKWL